MTVGCTVPRRADVGRRRRLDIRHGLFIEAPASTVAAALIEPEQIQQWWTNEARVEDGRLIVGWSGLGWEVEFATIHDPSTHTVVWHCLRSNMQNTNAWESTTITFVLTPQAGGTHLDFAQTGYRESPCYDVCVQGWAFFVGTSLKQYVETGTGIPYPQIQDTRDL